ncbi:unnamed protein product, partial [Mesorhabditis spiculigera]
MQAATVDLPVFTASSRNSINCRLTENESQAKAGQLRKHFSQKFDFWTCANKEVALVDLRVHCHNCQKTLPNLEELIRHTIGEAHIEKVYANGGYLTDEDFDFWYEVLEEYRL